VTEPLRLLTEPEAAEAMRVCPRTLRKARQDGKLTYVLIGRAVRYTMDDLDAFIAASKQDRISMRQQPAVVRSNAARSGKIIPFTERRR